MTVADDVAKNVRPFDALNLIFEIFECLTGGGEEGREEKEEGEGGIV